MWDKIILMGLYGLLWAAGLWLASRHGSKAAQLEALKAELKKQAQEQERANAVFQRVDNLTNDDVRQRLQDTKRN